MRNFNMLRRDEGGAMTNLVMYLSGYVVGSLIQGFVWYHNGYDSGKEDQSQLAHVQQNNEQIQTQLSDQFQHVRELILNDGNKTFTFDMRDVNGVKETCNGSYVERGMAAHIAGTLSCSQTVNVLPNPSPTH